MTDKPHQALLPAGWPRPKGYANGVAATQARPPGVHRRHDRLGRAGRLPDRRFRRAGAPGPAHVVAVLTEAGGRPQHITRMTWYVTDKREYLAAGRAVGQAFKDLIGHFDIAMTAVQVVALIEDRAKVEIEVTAVIPD
jgi:hypothetical protein